MRGQENRHPWGLPAQAFWAGAGRAGARRAGAAGAGRSRPRRCSQGVGGGPGCLVCGVLPDSVPCFPCHARRVPLPRLPRVVCPPLLLAWHEGVAQVELGQRS